MKESQTIMTNYNKAENLNSHCIKSIFSQNEKNQFIFCTNSLNKENQIHFIDYNEDCQKIQKYQIYNHQGILNDIFPLINNQNQTFLSYVQGQQQKLKLMDFQQFQNQQYQNVFEIDWENQIIDLNQKSNKIIIADQLNINIYDYENNKIEQKIEFQNIQKIKNDPHHENLTAIAHKNNISIQDFRDNQNQQIQNAHNLQVLDIDFNPNKQNYLISCGQDYSIKFWDLRKPICPLKIISDLSNWPLNCLYNSFHDQLILSSYDDGSINLHKIISTSSATIIENDIDVDQLIKNYDEYDDSVQSITWSSNSAWIFASISYSGNVIINQVPKNEKYKILL